RQLDPHCFRPTGLHREPSWNPHSASSIRIDLTRHYPWDSAEPAERNLRLPPRSELLSRSVASADTCELPFRRHRGFQPSRVPLLAWRKELHVWFPASALRLWRQPEHSPVEFRAPRPPRPVAWQSAFPLLGPAVLPWTHQASPDSMPF